MATSVAGSPLWTGVLGFPLVTSPPPVVSQSRLRVGSYCTSLCYFTIPSLALDSSPTSVTDSLNYKPWVVNTCTIRVSNFLILFQRPNCRPKKLHAAALVWEVIYYACIGKFLVKEHYSMMTRAEALILGKYRVKSCLCHLYSVCPGVRYYYQHHRVIQYQWNNLQYSLNVNKPILES